MPQADGVTASNWFVRAVRPKTAPVPWAAAARAVLALAGPTAVGIACGNAPYGVLVSMGALAGVLEDRHGAYRLRLVRMLVPLLAAAVGIGIGHEIAGRGWVTVGTLVVVATVAGVISPIGALASTSGLVLLLQTIIGTGVPLPGQWWLPPLLLFSGGLLVVLLALAGWPLRRGMPERAAVAAVYRATAGQLWAAGDPAGVVEARRRTTAAMDAAYDTLVRHRAVAPGGDREVQRLMGRLNAVNPLLEATTALAARPRVDPAYARAVERLADVVEAGRDRIDLPGVTDARPPRDPVERAFVAALCHAAGRLGPPAPQDPRTGTPPDAERGGTPPDGAAGAGIRADADLLGLPASWGPRGAVRQFRDVVTETASWLYGARLALCVAVASVLVHVVDLPRSYWVLLTITIVLKPDFGSVFVRALLRALGTVVGVVIAAALLTLVPGGWATVPVVAVLGLLLPIASSRGHGLQTAALTPLVLVLTNMLNHGGVTGLVPARLTDSLLGCGIVLVFGYLFWPDARQAHLRRRVAATADDTAAYLRLLLAEGGEGRAERSRLRRRAYGTLTRTRTAFQQTLAEPPPASRRAAAWWPFLVALERTVDAVAAASAAVDHGAARPGQADVDRRVAELQDLASAVREGRAPSIGTAPTAEAISAPSTALDAVAMEIGTARSLMRSIREAARDGGHAERPAASAGPGQR